MKKIVAMLLMGFIAVSGIYADEAKRELTPEQLKEIKMRFPTVFTEGQVTIDKGIDHGKFKQFWVIVRTPQGNQKFESFVFNDIPDILVAGAAYDVKGEKIALPLDAKTINDAVMVKMGTGEKQVYLVTDPECPYCQRLESNITPDVLKKYTINVIPMPLSFHPKAKPMLYWVLDAPKEEQAKRLSKVLTGDTEFEKFKPSAELKAKADAIIEKGFRAAEELNAQGTPSLFDDKFQPLDPSVLLSN
ncbi:thioredoxin fold domain-containing protein [Campylobacter sp. MOP7]|uniref:thioredoxin fold domain-containing protein n=1 Tax=Campylobacter canis TaxID=3378588 RepID=UPI00387E3C52